MKGKPGIGLHILLWSVYFGLNLFNELYLSSSFTAHPSTELLLSSTITQLLILFIKIPAVYYVLNSLIPRWLQSPVGKTKLVIEFIIIFLLLLLCYRGLIHFIIWPLVYKEEPLLINKLEYIARFFYSLLDLLQVTGIAAAIHLFRLRIAAVKNEKLLLQEKLESEMQFLRSQINPHFLFNTLNSIYALARIQSSSTPDVVMRLSKILRYVLYESEKKLIAIDEELRITQDYIELQQIRFGNKVRVAVEKHIDDTTASITPLIMLPLMENAFKHGTSDITTCAEIKLYVSLIKDYLKIKVTNPLGGLSVKPTVGEGIGLTNIQRRLQLLYSEHELIYGKRDGHFLVELNINLNSYAASKLLNH